MFKWILIFAVCAFSVQGPIISNGFDHFVFWKAADSCLYHVAVSGAARDTHLVKRYQAYYLSRDTLLAGVGGYGPADSSWTNNAAEGDGARYTRRHDTLIISDTLEAYSPAIVLQDTTVYVHLGSLGRDPKTVNSSAVNYNGLGDVRSGDFLVVNGVRVQIAVAEWENAATDRRLAVRVRKNVPTGTNLKVNATYRTLPCLKTLSKDSEYRILKDVNQKNKLYLFYLSDSGRIVGEVSWDNGLSWEEMVQTRTNPVCTDSSDHHRSGLNVSSSGGGSQILLTWSGIGTTMTSINVPATLDTVFLFVRPQDNSSADKQLLSTSDISTFHMQHSINTPFNSIDRAIHQILMLENNKTHAEVLQYSSTDTAMGVTRAVATRNYIIKMLPGEYDAGYVDGGLAGQPGDSGALNKIWFPAWDRSLTIESYYSNPDSFCVINSRGPGGIYRIMTEFGYGAAAPGNHSAVMRAYPFEHITFNRLKITSLHHDIEHPTNAAAFYIPGSGSVANLRVTNNLFFSTDSSRFSTNGQRLLKQIFFAGPSMSLSGTSTLTNVIMLNNIFHRCYEFNWNDLQCSRHDYSAGLYMGENTLYKWILFSTLWTRHSWAGKISFVNNICDNAPSPFAQPNCDADRTDEYRYLGWQDRGNAETWDTTIYYADTSVWSPVLHKPALDWSAAHSGATANFLDSLAPNDFYGIPRAGAHFVGACVPAPDNPLTLSATPATLNVTDPNLKITISNIEALAAGIDTVRIFWDTLGFCTNVLLKADTAFPITRLRASYVSRNRRKAVCYYTIAVGQSYVQNGRKVVNWSAIKIPQNGVEYIDESQDCQQGLVPQTAFVGQNYPNPFNPSTSIRFGLPSVGPVGVVARLDVYDIRGNRVVALEKRCMAAGVYRMEWDGKDSQGQGVSSGVYYSVFRAGSLSKKGLMLLVK